MEYKEQFYLALCLIVLFNPVAPSNTCSPNLLFDEDHDDPSSYRLPQEVVPTSYNVTVLTKEDSFEYEGSVEIRLKVLAETKAIILHSDKLVIDESTVHLYRRVSIDAKRKTWHRDPILCQFHDAKRQFYVIVPERLLPNEYLLAVKFVGEIQDDVFGFYRSLYLENGESKWMAVTQFSPTYARRAFPCMDEPRFKAVFELNIGAHNRTVTSNTRRSDKSGSYVHKFVTPVMATYQVGWTIHDFVSETPTNDSSDFQMWTRRSMGRRGSIALSRSIPVFSFLNEWLQAGNPISKMDQVAVPDFNFHAMENWGMITYRESVVLYEDEVTPTNCMVDGLATMAHEFAHTWFGNLVTPVFWDVAWLKEGFAAYFQHFAVSKVYPAWQMMDKFVVDTLQQALLLDSANHSRSMNGRNVGSPQSIMAVLDFVSYKKAASVIRMVSHAIGESVFQRGLQMYLRNRSYQAVTPFDLYTYLQAAVNASGNTHIVPLVQDVMESWANQPGFPLVTVSRDYKTETITVCQEPFGRYPNSSSFEWWIPLNFALETLPNFSNAKPRDWLKPEDKCRNILLNVPTTSWVVFNIQQTGYYRVNYDEKNWQMLANYLKSRHFQKIHKLNRAALIDDSFNLARWGYVDYAVPFNLSSYLLQESDYEPWVAAANSFKFLNKMLNGVPDVQRAFQEYAVHLVKGVYEKLSFTESEGEDITTKLQRESVLSISCLLRSADCLSKSDALFEKWISSLSEPIPKDVKSFVYCEGIRSGSDKDWDTMYTRWQNTDLQTEQELLLQGLACTRNPRLIDRLLQLSTFDERNVRKQQRMIIVNAALNGNAENVEHVLKYTQFNLQEIIRLRGYDFLGKIFTAIGKAMTTEKQTKQLEIFVWLYEEELGPALDSAKQALEESTGNVKWLEKFAPSIADYFERINSRNQGKELYVETRSDQNFR